MTWCWRFRTAPSGYSQCSLRFDAFQQQQHTRYDKSLDSPVIIAHEPRPLYFWRSTHSESHSHSVTESYHSSAMWIGSLSWYVRAQGLAASCYVACRFSDEDDTKIEVGTLELPPYISGVPNVQPLYVWRCSPVYLTHNTVEDGRRPRCFLEVDQQNGSMIIVMIMWNNA